MRLSPKRIERLGGSVKDNTALQPRRLMSISDHIYDHACTDYPLPIAETVVSLAAADNEHEERDRIVECFRAIIRTLSVLALAAVVGRGSEAGIDRCAQSAW